MSSWTRGTSGLCRGGPTGRGGGKGRMGRRGSGRKRGGTFRVPGGLLFRTPEEAEAHLRAALEE